LGEKKEKMTEDNEGKLRDLAEKRLSNEITAREAYDEVYRRGLQHGSYSSPLTSLGLLAGGILCYITFFAGVWHLPLLSDLSQLPTIVFPAPVIYLAVILLILATVVMVHTTYLRATKGGTGWKGESETVILVKEGLYSVVRHGVVLGFSGFFTFLTIILSPHVPFNILSVIGNIIFFLACYYSTVEGERLNVMKWGDEYRQYMREVPRCNFVLGLWRWAKRRNRQE
jgi:protein-S-isoprenylcysteine O-methyltransferase Ste14